MKIKKHNLTRQDVLNMLQQGAALVIGKEGDYIEVVIKDTDNQVYVLLSERMPYSFCWGIIPPNLCSKKEE